MNRLLVLLASFAVISCVKLPPNFKKCNRNEPTWKECVLEAGRDGIPQLNRRYEELNLPNIEPFTLPELSISGGSGTSVVTQTYKKSKISGLTKIKVDKLEFDFANKMFEVAGVVPELEMMGPYKLDGKILLLPVQGEGDSVARLKNVKVELLMKYEEVKKKGKTHMKYVSGKAKIQPGSVFFRFENLFNGDKILGEQINTVINENWKVFYEDMEETFEEVVMQIVINMVNKFFAKVSIEEAFD
ncbi:hypothetical protein MTP99_008223 [Tenebrio molitor]|nr:hypothetical protein MTP99_008223 [Tenebrio molitor]